MQKNDVLKNGEEMIRVLEIQHDRVLIVICSHQSMPMWMSLTDLNSYTPCSEDEITASQPDLESLTPDLRRITHERFTAIAGILPFIGDECQRRKQIERASEEHGISKQTIRRYLYRCLVHQSISALAPRQKRVGRALTRDEKNMRWALNKFFYTRRKSSLTTAYPLMLKEKYCDLVGKLMPEYLTIWIILSLMIMMDTVWNYMSDISSYIIMRWWNP